MSGAGYSRNRIDSNTAEESASRKLPDHADAASSVASGNQTRRYPFLLTWRNVLALLAIDRSHFAAQRNRYDLVKPVRRPQKALQILVHRIWLRFRINVLLLATINGHLESTLPKGPKLRQVDLRNRQRLFRP